MDFNLAPAGSKLKRAGNHVWNDLVIRDVDRRIGL